MYLLLSVALVVAFVAPSFGQGQTPMTAEFVCATPTTHFSFGGDFNFPAGGTTWDVPGQSGWSMKLTESLQAPYLSFELTNPATTVNWNLNQYSGCSQWMFYWNLEGGTTKLSPPPVSLTSQGSDTYGQLLEWMLQPNGNKSMPDGMSYYSETTSCAGNCMLGKGFLSVPTITQPGGCPNSHDCAPIVVGTQNPNIFSCWFRVAPSAEFSTCTNSTYPMSVVSPTQVQETSTQVQALSTQMQDLQKQYDNLREACNATFLRNSTIIENINKIQDKTVVQQYHLETLSDQQAALQDKTDAQKEQQQKTDQDLSRLKLVVEIVGAALGGLVTLIGLISKYKDYRKSKKAEKDLDVPFLEMDSRRGSSSSKKNYGWR